MIYPVTTELRQSMQKCLFKPDRMSTQIIARILVKQIEDQFKTLIVLSHYLETARFRQLWDEAAKSRHIVDCASMKFTRPTLISLKKMIMK